MVGLAGIGGPDDVDRDRAHLARDVVDRYAWIAGRGGSRAAGGLERHAQHVTTAPGLFKLGWQLPRRQAEIADRIGELGLRWTPSAHVLQNVTREHPRAAGREVCVLHSAGVALELG